MTAGPTIFTGPALTADGIAPRAVHVRDGVITAVNPWRPGDQPDHDSEMITLGPDEVLIPGLVDTHVHVNEPGRTEWEGFATATRAAAAGGVTTILDMPLNSIPATTDPHALEIKRRAAAGHHVSAWGAG